MPDPQSLIPGPYAVRSTNHSEVHMDTRKAEVKVVESRSITDRLAIHPELTRRLLVEFIRNETRKFGFNRVVLALSGGIDSALAAYLGAEALGAANVFCIMMPYRTSSPESLAHAQLVAD